VLLRIVARLAAVKGVLFGRQVQVRISIPTKFMFFFLRTRTSGFENFPELILDFGQKLDFV
jgi:hypothetical protein